MAAKNNKYLEFNSTYIDNRGTKLSITLILIDQLYPFPKSTK